MKRLRLIFIAVIAGFLVLGGLFVLFGGPEKKFSKELFPIQIKGTKISVELATLPDEQALGLEGRDGLPENRGMLFVYDKPAPYSFWMKNMKFPIDIIWVDEKYRIVDITKNLSPATFPQSFQPSKPAQYVLEVNAGFTEKNNIAVGDAVTLSSIFPAPKSVEVLFVEDAKNDQVIVLDLDGNIVKRIPVGEKPHDIAISPDNKYVVTGNNGDGTVSIIEVKTLSEVKRAKTTGDSVHGVVFAPDGKYLFATNQTDNSLTIIETENFSREREVAVGYFPEYVGVTKDGSKVFTTNNGNGGSLTVLTNNGFDSKVIKTLKIGIDPHGWAVSPDGSKVVITNLGSNVTYVLDSQTFEEKQHIDTGATTEFAAFKNDEELWVTDIGARYVSLIDVVQNKILKQIEVGETPHGISFSSDKKLAFVPLYNAGEVVIIDVAKREVVKKVKIGDELHNSAIVKVNKYSNI